MKNEYRELLVKGYQYMIIPKNQTEEYLRGIRPENKNIFYIEKHPLAVTEIPMEVENRLEQITILENLSFVFYSYFQLEYGKEL